MEARYFIVHVIFGVVIAVLSAAITFILSRHIKALDVPNERSSHTKVTPRGGGIAIVVSFLVGISLIHLIGNKTPIYTPYFLGFLFSSFVIATLSFYDDFHVVSFRVKLSGQSALRDAGRSGEIFQAGRVRSSATAVKSTER